MHRQTMFLRSYATYDWFIEKIQQQQKQQQIHGELWLSKSKWAFPRCLSPGGDGCSSARLRLGGPLFSVGELFWTNSQRFAADRSAARRFGSIFTIPTTLFSTRNFGLSNRANRCLTTKASSVDDSSTRLNFQNTEKTLWRDRWVILFLPRSSDRK